jgi:hypothetical protein
MAFFLQVDGYFFSINGHFLNLPNWLGLAFSRARGRAHARGCAPAISVSFHVYKMSGSYKKKPAHKKNSVLAEKIAVS